MSRENVHNLRACFALLNEEGVRAATVAFDHLLDPEFGIEEAIEMPDRESYVGKEAFIANLAKLEESFEQLRIEPLEFIDLDDRIVVVVKMTGRGHDSGAPVEMTFAQLWSLHDGRARSLHDYATKDEALEAAGLRE
jgi:ketosteroid isomerase-like protein